jgi:hypothetical protein
MPEIRVIHPLYTKHKPLPPVFWNHTSRSSTTCMVHASRIHSESLRALHLGYKYLGTQINQTEKALHLSIL